MPETQSERLAAALALHQRGNLAEADALYREILKDNPDDADTFHLLGLVAGDAGHQAEAIALIRRAIRIRPDPVFSANLGVAFSRAGNWTAALTCFLQALTGRPDDARTWNRAARAMLQLGQRPEAKMAFERAAALDPGLGDAHFQLGNLHYHDGERRESIECYRSALRLRPENAEAHYNLGVALSEEGDTDGALAEHREAIRIDTGHARAHNNAGTLLQAKGRVAEAVERYVAALRACPEFTSARYNLGVALQELERVEEAIEAYREVLGREPGHAEAHNNLGNALLASGRPREALECYRAALDSQPEHVEARWNSGVVSLLLGDFERGWEGYEWRLQQREVSPRTFHQAQWDGESLDGRTILLHAEQGLGDTIQFARYAPLVCDAGGRVFLECQPSLARLLASVDGVERVVERGAELPEFDVQLPLMSLPRVFGTRLATIPSAAPYVRCPSGDIGAAGRLIEERVGGDSRLRIGVVWAGNPRHKNDRRRSIEPQLLKPLAETPGVKLLSLQKGIAVAAGFSITTVEEGLADFAATGALMMHLDLVITVDTSVAHLAGALGRPVWTLLPYVPDWRWMLETSSSPWYPSMRLFRQASPGDWEGVIANVSRELRRANVRQAILPARRLSAGGSRWKAAAQPEKAAPRGSSQMEERR